MLVGGSKNLSLSREFFSEDYAVINATERCEKSILDAKSVSSVEKMLFIPGSSKEVIGGIKSDKLKTTLNLDYCRIASALKYITDEINEIENKLSKGEDNDN